MSETESDTDRENSSKLPPVAASGNTTSSKSKQISTASEPTQLLDHFFRHSYGRLVAALVGALGLARLDLVEDVAQDAMLQALESWKWSSVPDEPMAWLIRVAKNRAIDRLRRENTADQYEQLVIGTEASSARVGEEADTHFASEIGDRQLQMVFACCHPELPPESQIAITLRFLGGLNTREIAAALLVSEEAMQKRIARGKRVLKQLERLEIPSGSALEERLASVHHGLYLLFSEGYSSKHPDNLIRYDLCREAIRLTTLLAEHDLCGTGTTWALLALQYLHYARLQARLDAEGGLLLLPDQDRDLWDKGAVALGLECLDRSGGGETISVYHIQAGIAAQHCVAPRFADTNWPAILELYDQLLSVESSPIWELNRAVAVAEVYGIDAGRRALHAIDHAKLKKYYLYHAVRARLAQRAGDHEAASAAYERALDLTSSSPERALLARRLAAVRSANRGA